MHKVPIFVTQEMFDQIEDAKTNIILAWNSIEKNPAYYYKLLVNFRARFGLEFFDEITVENIPEKYLNQDDQDDDEGSNRWLYIDENF